MLPTSSARAQYSYGYDSFVGYPQSASFWNGAGYSGVYTDMSTQVHAAGTVEPYRGVAPYTQPPFGSFGSNGLTYIPRQPAVAPRANQAVRVVPRRRLVFGNARPR